MEEQLIKYGFKGSSKGPHGRIMKKVNYNHNIAALEVPFHLTSEGIIYAKENRYHNIRIMPSKDIKNEKLDLSGLTDNDAIFSVNIHEDVDIRQVDFTPLYSMSNLTKLQMKYLKGCIDFNKLSNLETLYITGGNCELGTINIRTLRDLLLVSMKNSNCEFISSLSNLEALRIYSRSIRDLSGIEGLDSLKSLEVYYSPNIVDISAVNKLRNLSRLELEKCKRLTDFSCLANNESITYLFISELDSISFVPSMNSIQHIKFRNLIDGNLDYLLESPTLKTVDFYPNKRHYNYTNEEIDEIMSNR